MKIYKLGFLLLLLAGCGDMKENTKEENLRLNKISIFCDKGKGVEYLNFYGYKAGGLAIRYNQNGSVSKCEKLLE